VHDEPAIENPGMTSRRRDADFPRDSARVLGLALVSLLLALAANHLRSAPLSLTYQSPQERLTAELTSLVEAPAFRLADLDAIGLDAFRTMVDSHGTALILDAREESFYSAGHVPGALNLSRQDFARDYARLRATLESSKDKPVAVYCSGGACHDSRLVGSALISLGFTRVKIFTGGWTAWTQAGEPTAH
jgi:rhodanese-related sulfurtransferase